jgi:vitamin K-dependent gamma-carboxylase
MTIRRPDQVSVGAARVWNLCSSHLFAPIDAAWLAAFRILFGLTMAASMLRFIAYGWIDALYVEPRFHFKYWGFGWVGDPSAGQAHALFYALTALGLLMAAGLAFRITAVTFAIGFALVQLIDVTTYLNHYYLATLLACLLAVSPAGKQWSLDGWLERRLRRKGGERTAAPPDGESGRVARAWLYLFRFQVAVVYTFAGLAKAQPDWLLHAQPLRLWLGASTDLPFVGPLFGLPWVAPVLSWAGFLFDSSIAFWMLHRRARPLAYAAIIVFHVLTRALFPIGMFPVIMILGALVFFEPSWPRELLSRVWSKALRHGMQLRMGELLSPARAASCSVTRRSRPHQLALAAGLLYCGLSLVMPLRWLAYGGDVSWHEQGMRWSWRVMVREKNGAVTFRVREPSTNRQWFVPPRTYLNELQEREMSGQPDLILQLAHRIRDDAARQLSSEVEVYVDATVSLNGRRARPLIDPSIDLARVEDGLGVATWIMPASTEPPPRIRPI